MLIALVTLEDDKMPPETIHQREIRKPAIPASRGIIQVQIRRRLVASNSTAARDLQGR
jgi:hypothetical protein